MRKLLALALALTMSGSVAYLKPIPRHVTFTPIPIDRDHPERRQVGLLEFDGGWKLTSDSPDFGGISSMHVGDTGHVVAVSDRGTILEFNAPPHGPVQPLRHRPVPAGPGPKSGFSFHDRDIESMTMDPASGRIWLGYEVHQAVWRYRADFAGVDGHFAQPPEMQDWGKNSGAEAMVRMRDGRFLIFCEGRPGSPGPSEALLFIRDPLEPQPPPVRFHYRGPKGFRITDAAQLPDGRLLALNRQLSAIEGVAAVITLIDPAQIVRDGIVKGREIARLERPLMVDNMEALSILPGRNGRISIWLGSDDNFSFFQQTLLMKFELDPKRLD